MSKKLTTEQFVKKAVMVHGDRFDYSASEYTGIRKKITIRCPVHGRIDVVAGNHLRGLGCNRCYFDSVRKKAIKRFLTRSAKTHEGYKYDYSLVEYKNIDSKIKIICKEHGVFETTPYSHMNGVGCPGCKGPSYRGFINHNKKTSLSKNEFVRRSQKKHGEKYDYSKSVYLNNRVKTEIICPEHGSFFQEPDNHMKGVGCPQCYYEKSKERFVNNGKKIKQQKSKSLIKDLRDVHGDKYDYSRAVYNGWYGQIEIICPIHGPFFQTAHHHKSGAGCQQCAPSGFDGSAPAILYYLEIRESGFCKPVYKIGITNRSVMDRYPLDRDREKIKVLGIWKYPLGEDARKEEKRIVRKHKDKAYDGSPPLDGVGIAEMFSEDVLNLSKNGINEAKVA